MRDQTLELLTNLVQLLTAVRQKLSLMEGQALGDLESLPGWGTGTLLVDQE